MREEIAYMARGWESKSIADQIDDAERKATRGDDQLAASPDERAKADKLAALKMSRSRLLDQLEGARNPRHRTMLANALKAVESDLADLNSQ
jgi:hypothetical protein